ncbi:UDP-N-acetylglucosamine 2-epimerase [Glaesserella parasuis]|uniref:UDP-N-acetylglucosamine 2-epimerase n=1 Tax=Glaesserella parasuis TaxID=738 RepID=UPI001F33998B|nr:UDP-N-acetylglucosamine 2-epimerase [Glaesserella parasuis]
MLLVYYNFNIQGTNTEYIVQSVKALLNDPQQYQQMSHAQNPYGDGNASERIVAVIKQLAQGTM